MALATYDELVAGVILGAQRTGDSEFAAFVPLAVQMAHTRIFDRLRISEMEEICTALAEDVTDGAVGLPHGFLELRSCRIGTSPQTVLTLASPDFLHEWADTTSAGVSRFYTITGSTLRTYPFSSHDIIIDHWSAPDAPSATNESNWLLRSRPALYYYGALIECAPFMREEGMSMQETYAKMFERSMLDAHERDRRKRFPSAVVHVRGHTP